MEIGGYDTIIETNDPDQTVAEIVALLNWPNAVIEQDEGKDFFYYFDQNCKEEWDSEFGVMPENTMVYFLFRENELTVVTDEELTNQIRAAYENHKD